MEHRLLEPARRVQRPALLPGPYNMGVVLTPSNFYEQGQFSVNRQRPDANYFLVDGVSANLGNCWERRRIGSKRSRPASGKQRL
jgi:hypothetical protein